MSLCFACETYSVDIQQCSTAAPSLHAILKDTLRRVSYRLITLVACRVLTVLVHLQANLINECAPPRLLHPQGEAELNTELEEDEKLKRVRKMSRNHKVMKRHQPEAAVEEEERWPSPMEPFEYESDRDSPGERSSTVPLEVEEQTEEEKKYILEKIQQANRELLDQEPPHELRRRRLHFKDKLVDLVVPPLQQSGGSGANDGKTSSQEAEVSGRFSELKLSPRSSEGGRGEQEGKVLVEKDGKFDLVSLNEVESCGRLPPIASGEHGRSFVSSSSSSRLHTQHLLPAPRPPAQPRYRPSSASHGRRGGLVSGVRRRVQSATGTTGSQATYTMSAQQKELLQRVQRRKERLAKEVGTGSRSSHFDAWLIVGCCFNRPKRRSEKRTRTGSRRTSWRSKPGC